MGNLLPRCIHLLYHHMNDDLAQSTSRAENIAPELPLLLQVAWKKRLFNVKGGYWMRWFSVNRAV